MKWQNKLKVVRAVISLLLLKRQLNFSNLIGVVMASMRCFQKTIGVITIQIGVYNYNTKRYALYRSDMVDPSVILSLRRLLVGNNVPLIFIMHIEHEVKLNYDDVLIRPKRSTLGSRKEVDLERGFTIPIMNPSANNPDGFQDLQVHTKRNTFEVFHYSK